MSTTTLDTTTVRQWKRYPEYRAVRTETLAELPTHWRTNRLKFVTQINSEVLGEDTHPDYELQYIDIGNVDSLGRIHEEQTFRFVDAPSRARRRVRHGDVVISTVRTYLRAIATIENPPDNLIVSTGFAALRAGKHYDPRFLSRLIQSNEFVDSVVNHSEGVGYPAINPTELGGLPVWVPPLNEQRAIVEFLDRETSRIDSLIGHKERLIALLKEKRQVVISLAATRGLHRAAPMRDSGIPWLGMVPKHWQLISLRQLIRSCSIKLQDGNHGELHPKAEDYTASGIPFIMANNVRDGLVDFKNCKFISEEQARQLRIGFSLPGDVLLTHKGTIGEVAIVPKLEEIPFLMLTPQVIFYRILKHEVLDRDYLFVFLQTKAAQTQLRLLAGNQSTRDYISLLAHRDLMVLLPPHSEQKEIAERVIVASQDLRNAEDCVRKSIEHLQEYRTALVSAAVTGQIDVRGEVNS